MKKLQNTKLKTKMSSGFTLIELLVVIAITGILASFLMVNYVGVRAKARDAQRKADLRQIQSALELYKSDNGSYPASLPACNTSLTANGTIYMQKIPCDPSGASPFLYTYKTAFSNSAYTIAGCLESVNDKQKDSQNNPPAVDGTASITTCLGGNASWSYTLFSP